MKKVLYVATVDVHIRSFHLPYLKMLHDEGYEVHIACNFVYGNNASKEAIEEYKKEWKAKNIILHHIDFLRSPFSFKSFILESANNPGKELHERY